MKYKLKLYPSLLDTVNNMNVRELLKTVVCPQHKADDFSLEKGYLSLYLHPTTKENAAKFVEFYREEGKPEPVITADTECGAGGEIKGCTVFPSVMALGVADDAEMAYQVGLSAAKDCLECGYRWTFSPVVDVFYESETIIPSTRKFSNDPDQIIKIAGAYMRGMQDGGLVATIKHFPGGCSDHNDTHITMAVNQESREEWENAEGKIYRSLIEQGAMTVMVGHLSHPCMDEIDPETGYYPPATLSYNIMTGLLKEKLGFEGLITCDAVTMSAFCGYMNYYKACARYLKSGGDILLFARTDDVFYQKMEQLVESGELPLSILKDRAYRVLCFSKQINEEFHPIREFDGNLQEIADKVVEKSIRVIRDKPHILPFAVKEDTKILLVDFSNVYDGSDTSGEFYAFLKEKGYPVFILKDPGSETLARIAENREYDLILCSVANKAAFGVGITRVHGLVARNMMDGWTHMGTPVVFVSFGLPTLHKQFPMVADTVVNTYGIADKTFDVLEKTLFAASI